jgi:alkylation response protein AidB-like acyl-CoA dehydrogenase
MSTVTDPALADELVAAVKHFVTKEVLPVASDLEHNDTYPEDLVEQMKGMGLFGCKIPEEHGGLGLDTLTYARVIEELSAGWMSLSGVLNTHTMVATLLRMHGTDEQKKRLLPSMASGEVRGALSLSELGTGCRERHRRPALQGHP